MITGLVVAGGGFQGLPMLRALQALGARAVVADSLRENPNAYEADAYAVVPPIADRAALERALLRVCEEWEVDIVFPTTDRDLAVVADLAPELRRGGVVVAASPVRLVEAWADKVTLLEALRAAGLPVLTLASGAQSLRAPYPWLGKPRRGWGSRGVVTAADAAEHAAFVANDADGGLFWQPKLAAFAEWSVDFAVSEAAQVSPLVARERLRTSGGFAVVSRVDAAAPVVDVALRTARWLAGAGVCGVVNIQILVEPSGKQWVNDVNLRPGTSSGAALGAGVNFVAFMLGHANPGSPTSGMFVRTLRDRFLPLPFEHGIAGVALDLDDCLIDQKAWMDDKLSLVLADWEDFADPRSRRSFEEAARRTIDEGPWDRLLDVAVRDSGLDKALVPVLIERWRAAHPQAVAVYPDARAFIDTLRAAGVRIAVVTDNPAASQRQKLARVPLLESLDAVLLTAELGAPKPSPQGFLAAAQRLGLAPSRMIAVGDNPWRDGLGALAAGFAGAVVVPRRGGMWNASSARFLRAHPSASHRVHWADDLRVVPRMLGLKAASGSDGAPRV